MKNTLKICLTFVLLTTAFACNKETATTSTDVMQNMISNKTWYLDYSITGTVVQNFVGQATYYISFLKNGTTQDSDGLTGTYSIVNENGTYLLKVNAKTLNGNTLNYIHTLESVGDVKMVHSLVNNGQANKTLLFFTAK